MATLDDILADRQNYPDDQLIAVGGQEVQLGQLRGGWLRQQDYSRKTADLARQREELGREKSDFEYARMDAEAKLTEMASNILQANPGMSRQEAQEEAEASPAAQKLLSYLHGINQQVADLAKENASIKETMKIQQVQQFAEGHRRALAFLKQQDPNLNTEELVEFAKTTRTPNLIQAYKAMRFEDAVVSARRIGHEEGIQQGMAKAQTEGQPFFPSRRVLNPLGGGDEQTPRNFDEAVDAALSDPDIIQSLTGQRPY